MNKSLYQINTRVWVKRFGATARLKDVPTSYWQQLADLGIQYVWLMGVWQTGPNVLDYALEPGLQSEYSRVLPDWTSEDVIGSPYAIDRYEIDRSLGKEEDLVTTHQRILATGMQLILDFVPNHFHAETSWLQERPDVFLQTDTATYQRDPHTYYAVEGQYFAHGKDPYFAAWQDTIQVNYASEKAQAFMSEQLQQVAQYCDGVRCDMAMLLLPDVFHRTWGHLLSATQHEMADFWPGAIHQTKARHPNFRFLAEVYWDLEWHLQQQGFDYTYDKRLIDRLHEKDVNAIRDHLRADSAFQQQSIRFLENHDEDRALASMSPQQMQAAALIAYTIPGLRFFYEGQWEGRRQRLPVQLGRIPYERDDLDQYGRELSGISIGQLPGFSPVSQREPAFYDWLLSLLQSDLFQVGNWQLLDTTYTSLLVWKWHLGEDEAHIIVNYSPEKSSVDLASILGTEVARDCWGNAIATKQLQLSSYGWLVLM